MTLPATADHQIVRHVREAMSRNVPHARADDTISQVARHMSELGADQLVVVDGRSHVAGVVSQLQILRFYLSYVDETELDFAAAVVAASNVQIESLLSREESITIRHDAPLAQAALLMSLHGLGCLPVVDRYEELKGVIASSDLLRELTRRETSGLETGFEFFEPHANRSRQRPAYLRRSNKELVIPGHHIALEHEYAEKVMLGFDEASGRILLKFIPAGMKSENSLPIRRQAENMVISAEAFVQHYRLLDRSTTFDVQLPEDSRYLVMVPR